MLKRINKDGILGSDTFKVFIMTASASELCISIHDEYPDTAGGTPEVRTFSCRLNGQFLQEITPQRYSLSGGANYRSQKVIYHLVINLSEVLEEAGIGEVMYLLELFVVVNERNEPICLEEFVLDGDAFEEDEDDFEEMEIATERLGALPAKSTNFMDKMDALIDSNHQLTNQLLNLAAHLPGTVKVGRNKTSA